ncbi:MAG: metallophosphoesterase, partial [Kiritimatiellae bacterium]|nr:metallophosphoesterase [Kiritimatiellia bacterium]
MNRREFLVSAGAVTLLQGCRSFDLFGAPEMSFGVVSDPHVTTPKSAALLEKSFRFFKRRGVDAVMVPGDITDWGVRPSLVYVRDAWNRVFAGTGVTPLFCTGNHDFDGWCYGDMTMEMHANGYSEADRLVKRGMDVSWEDIFGVKFAGIRRRRVKGYDFISGEWRGYEDLSGWMAQNGASLKGGRPFFYFQHLPIKGTTSDSSGWADNGLTKPVLAQFPNCVAFTGHQHHPFIDERSAWQGEFTVFAVPSLSYASLPSGFENGEGPRNGKSKQAMRIVPARRDLRGGQGFVVNVWPDRVAVERWDMEEEESDCP